MKRASTTMMGCGRTSLARDDGFMIPDLPTILKEVVRRTGTDPRWLPDVLQLADLFTKEKLGVIDFFWAVWMSQSYQIRALSIISP